VILCFQVFDTIAGIAFDPFYQAGARDDQGEETGQSKVGFAISRILTELLGDKLDVKSKPGSGTAFHLALLMPETSPVIQPADDQKQEIIGILGEPPLVLVVDDKPENRSVLIDMLMPLGFKTIDAEKGMDGFDKATESQPDPIVTDLVMPKSDGFEFIRRLRGASLLKDTVVIAVSASAYKEDQERCLEAGADAFLPKPLDFEKLSVYLKKFLNFEWVLREPPNGDRQAVLPSELIPPELILLSGEILNALLDVAQIGEVTGLREKLAELGSSDQAMLP